MTRARSTLVSGTVLVKAVVTRGEHLVTLGDRPEWHLLKR